MTTKLKYGDIIQFKPKESLVSKAIVKIDKSPYCHSAFFIGYKMGVPLFIESHESKGGTVMTKLEEWANYDVFRPTRKFKARPKPLKEALRLLNTPYDYSRLWWILKADVLGFNLSNNDDKKLICSELVDSLYHYALGGGYICTPATIYKLYKAGLLKKIK